MIQRNLEGLLFAVAAAAFFAFSTAALAASDKAAAKGASLAVSGFSVTDAPAHSHLRRESMPRPAGISASGFGSVVTFLDSQNPGANVLWGE